jgi:hypothetical protein
MKLTLSDLHAGNWVKCVQAFSAHPEGTPSESTRVSVGSLWQVAAVESESVLLDAQSSPRTTGSNRRSRPTSVREHGMLTRWIRVSRTCYVQPR